MSRYPELDKRNLKVFDFNGMPNVALEDIHNAMTPEERARWNDPDQQEAWTRNYAGAVYAYDMNRWFEGFPTDD